MVNRFIPKPTSQFLDRGGLVTPVWRDYLNSLTPQSASNEIQAQIANLQAQIDAINQGGGQSGNVFGRYSVKHYGTLADGTVYLQLDGDVPAPGIRKVYGTNELGMRGWIDFPEPPEPPEQLFQRMDANGDFRVTADGNLRVTN